MMLTELLFTLAGIAHLERHIVPRVKGRLRASLNLLHRLLDQDRLRPVRLRMVCLGHGYRPRVELEEVQLGDRSL